MFFKLKRQKWLIYIELVQERITTTKKGSITSVQAIYVPADDLTDPAPATTFAHLDATTVLSRAIAELGIYPAVDPLDSTSRKSIFRKNSPTSIDAHSKHALPWMCPGKSPPVLMTQPLIDDSFSLTI